MKASSPSSLGLLFEDALEPLYFYGFLPSLLAPSLSCTLVAGTAVTTQELSPIRYTSYIVL